MKLADISLVYNLNDHLNKNGEALIQIRIYLNGERKLISTGTHVKPDEWDTGKMQVKGRKDKDLLNIQLRDKIRAYEDQQDNLYKRSRTITIGSILSLKNPELHGGKSFISFCRKEIEVRADITPNTKRHHRTYLTRLIEFRNEIYFSDIDFTMLKDFENFLLNYEFTKQDKVYRLSKTRVFKYLKFFRTYVNLAIKKELFEEHLSPFKKWDISIYTKAERQAALRKTYLDFSEIKRIEALTFKGDSKHLNTIKEFFLFQCYSGLAYNDMIRIKREHVIYEVNLRQGKGYTIQINRGKTDQPIYIPIYLMGLEAGRILDKRMKRPGKYIFDELTGQYINRELKRIARAAGIDKNITSHVGRHSCAMLLRKNGISIDVIQRILGHSSLKSTQIYASIDHDIIRESLMKVSFN